MKRLISILFISLLIIAGCSNDSYTRDTNEGEIVEISLAEWKEKMEDKDDFLVVFSQLYCMGCNELHTMLDAYLSDHNVKVYEVILDYEEATPFENQDIINEYLEDFDQTPGVYFIDSGKKKEQLLPQEAVQKEQFDKFVQTYQIDEKSSK